MSSCAAWPGPRIRLRGLAGEYTKDHLDIQEAQLIAGMRPGSVGFGEDPPDEWGRLIARDGSTRAVPTERGAYATFYRQMRLAILGRPPVPVDPADSAEVLRVLQAAVESARTGESRSL